MWDALEAHGAERYLNNSGRFPAEALRLCAERDSGTVDALFSDSEEGELLRVLDSLFPDAAP